MTNVQWKLLMGAFLLIGGSSFAASKEDLEAAAFQADASLSAAAVTAQQKMPEWHKTLAAALSGSIPSGWPNWPGDFPGLECSQTKPPTNPPMPEGEEGICWYKNPADVPVIGNCKIVEWWVHVAGYGRTAHPVWEPKLAGLSGGQCVQNSSSKEDPSDPPCSIGEHLFCGRAACWCVPDSRGLQQESSNDPNDPCYQHHGCNRLCGCNR